MTSGAIISIISITVTVVLFVAGHIIASCLWAGSTTAKLNILVKSVDELTQKMNNFNNTCFTKEEAEKRILDSNKQHKAMWELIDRMKKNIRKLFFKAGIPPEEEE